MKFRCIYIYIIYIYIFDTHICCNMLHMCTWFCMCLEDVLALNAAVFYVKGSCATYVSFTATMGSIGEWEFVPPLSDEGTTEGDDDFNETSDETDSWSYRGSLVSLPATPPEDPAGGAGTKLVLQIVHHHHYHVCRCCHPCPSDVVPSVGEAGAGGSMEPSAPQDGDEKKRHMEDDVSKPALKRSKRMDFK